MRQLLISLLYFYISCVHTQILFECNFDNSTENCFTPGITVSSNIGIAGTVVPNAPLSDVTSSCKKNQHSTVFFK
jgi:hypothetical protein